MLTKHLTLVFLIKNNPDTSKQICLAMKKRGFGAGKWNGVGGKVQQNESIEECARREAQEEIGVVLGEISKVAELTFNFSNEPEVDNMVHVYICNHWQNEPTESEEMRPKWFDVNEINYDEMWADDRFWLPKVLDGENIKGNFKFTNDNTIIQQEVIVVGKFI